MEATDRDKDTIIEEYCSSSTTKVNHAMLTSRLRSQDPEERSHYQSFIDEDNIATKQAQTELDKKNP